MAAQNGIFQSGVDEKSITLGTSNQEFKVTEGYEQGLVRQLFIWLYNTTLTLGGGSGVAGGPRSLLRQLTITTKLHKWPIFLNLSGMDIYRIVQVLTGHTPKVTDATANGFNALFPIPLGHFGNLRHPSQRINDTALWCEAAKPVVEGQVGPITDIVSGGSPSGVAKVRVSMQYEPDPDPRDESAGGDKPKQQFHMNRQQFPTLQAGSGYNEVSLSIGLGRELAYIFLFERTNVDAEVADIVQGTTEVELVHGSDRPVKKMLLSELDAIVSHELGYDLPAGMHMIPVALDGKLSDARVLDAVSELKLRVNNLNTVASRVLVAVPMYLVPADGDVEPAAQRKLKQG